MTTLYDRIQEVRALYPDGNNSAVIPALRLAQEEYGWLSPDALREVADAVDVTPAYCRSVASFYEQFKFAPVGKHEIEVCTNVPCALYGAQAVVESFEHELGCHAGETSEDGEASLTTIECLGGCGWGTIVAVDGRYSKAVKPEDVPAIVKKVRR